MNPLPHEALVLVAERTIYKLLGELPPGWPPDPVQVDVVNHGTRAVLQLGPPAAVHAPPAPDEDTFSPREREVLAVVVKLIKDNGDRVVGGKIRAALGKKWSASTINQTLAELVGRRVLVNDNDKRGYGLAGDGAHAKR